MYINSEVSPSEAALIGALLLDKEAYHKIAHSFDPEFFENLEIKEIYLAIKSLVTSRKPIDIVSVAEVIGKSVEGKNVTLAHITELTFQCPSSANVEIYANQVKDVHTRKKLEILTNTIRKDLIDKDKSVSEIEIEATQILQGMMEKDIPSTTFTFRESLSNWYSNYLEIEDEENNGKTRTFYGIQALDEITHGIKKGSVHVIGARTSVGKTTLALNIFFNLATQKKKVLFLSMEMLEEQIMNRFLSRITEIPYWKFEKNKLSEKEKDQVTSILDNIAENWEIIFMYKGDLKAEDIELELMKRRTNQFDVVILDYIQLLHSKKQNRYEVVTESSNKIKALAMNYATSFIILAQLSRAAVGKEDEEPRLEHLKESGSLEQDAEVVLLMWRPSKEEACRAGKKVYIIVAKNRNGSSNITLELPADYGRMYISNQTLLEQAFT